MIKPLSVDKFKVRRRLLTTVQSAAWNERCKSASEVVGSPLFMIAKAVTIAGALCCHVVPAGANQIQGEARAQIMTQNVENCVDRHVKEPAYRPYTLATLSSYCSCLSNAILDGFSEEELESAAKKMPAAFASRRDAMDRKCVAEHFGKGQK